MSSSIEKQTPVSKDSSRRIAWYLSFGLHNDDAMMMMYDDFSSSRVNNNYNDGNLRMNPLSPSEKRHFLPFSRGRLRGKGSRKLKDGPNDPFEKNNIPAAKERREGGGGEERFDDEDYNFDPDFSQLGNMQKYPPSLFSSASNSKRCFSPELRESNSTTTKGEAQRKTSKQVEYDEGSISFVTHDDIEPIITGMDTTDEDIENSFNHSSYTPSLTLSSSPTLPSSSRINNNMYCNNKKMNKKTSKVKSKLRDILRKGEMINCIIRCSSRKEEEPLILLNKELPLHTKEVEEEFHEEGRRSCLSLIQNDDDVANNKALHYEEIDDYNTNVTNESSSRANKNIDDDGGDDNKYTQDYYSKPCNIKTALKDLPLTDFEKKAEERAAVIIRAWISDAGLIDELIENGGIENNNIIHPTAIRRSSISSSSIIRSGDDRIHEEQKKQQFLVKISEGVEVSALAGPIEGATKMDREIAKLKSSMKNQLDTINTCLNDGVAATNDEVLELTNILKLPSSKNGYSSRRLRELTTYITSNTDVEQANESMLSEYPKIKQTNNARHNFSLFFHELDVYNHIYDTCERLRGEIDSSKFKAHEWSVLLNVCREHSELVHSLFLLEKSSKESATESDKNKNCSASNQQVLRGSPVTNHFSWDKHRRINQFLEYNIIHVSELGDEIFLQIVNGVANAFEIAKENPAGLVDVVEAANIYESATTECIARCREDKSMYLSTELYFFGLKVKALGDLYNEMERRCVDTFRDWTMKAADMANEEEEAFNKQFDAVMKAANELTNEYFVKQQVAVCFSPDWVILMLWNTCAAYMCSNQILQQIGGHEGHNLKYLSVNQLLDLVSWVETFRENIEDLFPHISFNSSSKRMYSFDAPPKLLVAGNYDKDIDIEEAEDSLVWVNHFLWGVHDSSKDEFLLRLKQQTEKWIMNVYETDHTMNQNDDGCLITSLCEDVYSVAGTQLSTIRERLTRKSEALVQATSIILRILYEKQIVTRDSFLTNLETCCAAANDFLRMSENCDAIVFGIKEECNLTLAAMKSLEEQSSALNALYCSDAMYAGQIIHSLIFEPIEAVVAKDLFGIEWLNVLTHNELALTIIRTLDDFKEDFDTFLDEIVVPKTIEALISASVLFYFRILLSKSNECKDNKIPYFSDTSRALKRMADDISIIRKYFEKLAEEEEMPNLLHIINQQFGLLDIVHELMAVACGLSQSTAQDFVILLQKRVRSIELTTIVVGDIWHLMNPRHERDIYELLHSIEDEMIAIAPAEDNVAAVKITSDRFCVPGLRLDQVIAKHIDESGRKRPLKAKDAKNVELVVNRWKATWNPKSSKKKLLKPSKPSLNYIGKQVSYKATRYKKIMKKKTLKRMKNIKKIK